MSFIAVALLQIYEVFYKVRVRYLKIIIGAIVCLRGAGNGMPRDTPQEKRERYLGLET